MILQDTMGFQQQEQCRVKATAGKSSVQAANPRGELALRRSGIGHEFRRRATSASQDGEQSLRQPYGVVERPHVKGNQ